MIGRPVAPYRPRRRLSRPSNCRSPVSGLRCSRPATYTGTPRTSRIKTTKEIRPCGFAATAAGSIAIPDVTKNTGIKKPNASPLSLCSSCSSPWGSARRRMNPAANAPSTESSENALARTSSATRSSTVSRTVVCPVVSEPALISCITRVVPCCSRVHGRVMKMASAANTAKTTMDRPGPARTQQHRHRDHRAELTERTMVQHGTAERRAEHSGVLEDREQGAEGGRRERDRHRDLGMHRAAQPDQPDRGEGQSEADQPRHQCSAASATGQFLELDLVPGQQEQHAQPELAQQPDRLVRDRQAEHVGPDQHTEDEQQHDLGKHLPRHEAGQQRREDSAQRDPEQRHFRQGCLHDRSVGRRRRGRMRRSPRSVCGPRGTSPTSGQVRGWIPTMKLPTLRRRTAPTEVGGIVRVDRRTKNLTKRLKPGEIAVIHHSDLDRVSAEALVLAQAGGVVNAVRVGLGALSQPRSRHPARGRRPADRQRRRGCADPVARGRPGDDRRRPAAGLRRWCGCRGRTAHAGAAGRAAGGGPGRPGRSDRGLRRQHDDLPACREGAAARGRRRAGGAHADRGPARADRRPRVRLPIRPRRPAALHHRVQAAADGCRRRRRRAARGRLLTRHDHRRHGLLLRRGAAQRGRAGGARVPGRPRARAGAAGAARAERHHVPGAGDQRGRGHAARRLQGRAAAGGRRHPRVAGGVPRQGPGRDGVDLPDPTQGRTEAGGRQGGFTDLPQSDQVVAPGAAGRVGPAGAGDGAADDRSRLGGRQPDPGSAARCVCTG